MENSDLWLDGVPDSLHRPVRALTDCLRRVAGDALSGHTVFGPALLRDSERAPTPLESVAVFSRVDLDTIRRVAMEGRKLGRLNVRPPLVMTPEYIRASCDSFPVELLEIQQVHVTVYGGEFFSGLRFKRRDMRVQCERELKRALLQLRQGLLAAGGKDRLLGHVTTGVVEHTLRVLRGMLWLWDRPCPSSAREMVAEVEKAGGLSLGGLSAGLTPQRGNPYEAMSGVYNDLETLARTVNEIPT